jgi:hypothetical protein
MKKFCIIGLFFTFWAVCVLAGGDLLPFSSPMIKRWEPAEDPLLIEEYGLQDIQNQRRQGMKYVGVKGHTQISTSTPSTYTRCNNVYQFRKDSPTAETHIIAAQSDANNLTRLYKQTAAIPSQGNFTYWYSSTNASELDRFSTGPQGYLIHTNSIESQIWSGDEAYPIVFLTMADDITYTATTGSNDYTDRIRNDLQDTDNTVQVGGGNDSDVVLMLHMNGTDGSTTFTDSSTSGHSVYTAQGSAQLDTAYSKFGSASGIFESSTADYVNYTDSNDWFMSTGNFTIDFWVMFESTTANQGLIQQYQGANDYATLWWDDTINFLMFTIYSGGVEKVNIGAGWTPSLYTWYHIALVRNSNTWTFYIDGTELTNGTDADAWPDLDGCLDIGKYLDVNYLDGWMDEVRISKGVARWTSDFSAPSRAYISPQNYFLLGTPIRADGFKFYILSGTSESASLTMWQWEGVEWTEKTLTDNTSGLSSTEWVTWTHNTQSELRYLAGLALYWYKFALSDGEATIYKITYTGDLQPITNIWDGSETIVAGARLYTDTIQDYTDEVNDETTTFVMDLDFMPTSGYVLMGFTSPMQGVNLYVPDGKENIESAVLSVSFWNGTDWESVLALADGTSYTTTATSLSQSGVVAWRPPYRGTEFRRQIDENYPLWWYKFEWNAVLDSQTEIYYITGIPAPEPIDQDYEFSITYQNRTFLFKGNEAIYSASNAPYIYNGIDSGKVYFGDVQNVNAAEVLYNLYRTSGFYQLIVTKKSETYRMFGDNPDNWEVQKISSIVGNISPLSMALCEITDVGEGVRRNVLAWLSNSGFVICDGAAIIPIDDDVRNYFDSTHDDFIPVARQDDVFGWYDSNLDSYKVLISATSGEDYTNKHNVELEYSLKYREWTKLYREDASGANPLQAGLEVYDANGVPYSYGLSNDGYMYRLENGRTWNGTAIDQYLRTKDILMDAQHPLFRKTTIKYLKLLNTAKSEGEDITITHYCDGTETTMASTNQYTLTAHSMAQAYTIESCLLGPCLKHSFKFAADISAVDDGMEILGFGALYETQRTLKGR